MYVWSLNLCTHYFLLHASQLKLLFCLSGALIGVQFVSYFSGKTSFMWAMKAIHLPNVAMGIQYKISKKFNNKEVNMCRWTNEHYDANQYILWWCENAYKCIFQKLACSSFSSWMKGKQFCGANYREILYISNLFQPENKNRANPYKSHIYFLYF